MATPYELGTSPYPPNASPGAGAKIGVFLLVAAAIGAGVWYYISQRNPGDGTSEPEAEVAAATPSPEPTASPGAPTPAPTPAPTATAAAKPGQPGVVPPPAGQPRVQGRSRATIPAANDLSPTPSPAVALQAPVQPAPPPVAASPAPARSTSISRPPAPEPDPRIYDTATADVTPPSLLTPIGIAPVRTNYVPGLATIEVVVGADGLVQSAKAGRPPATVGETLEMMNWLSAAKSWQFGPAKKNSQPVKYRLVVPLSALVSGLGIR